MRKFALLAVLVLMVATFGTALAGVEFDDPSLCVAGKWLVVDAAKTRAVHVFVPQGTAYGNQRQGGCTTPAPAPLLPRSQVYEIGRGELMMVTVNGQFATPTVDVRYGDVHKVKRNTGGVLVFLFRVDD